MSEIYDYPHGFRWQQRSHRKDFRALYNAYISKACLRPFYDECGGVQIVVDRELKGRIQTAITKAILKFEMEIR